MSDTHTQPPVDVCPKDRRGPCMGCPFRRSNLESPDYAEDGMIIDPTRVQEVITGMREGVNYACHDLDEHGCDDHELACYGQMAMVAALAAQDTTVAAANSYRATRYQTARAIPDLITDSAEWQRRMGAAFHATNDDRR